MPNSKSENIFFIINTTIILLKEFSWVNASVFDSIWNWKSFTKFVYDINTDVMAVCSL